ncbi:MAG: hypothetical protein ACK4YP_20965, partial [Myxococcota bacterium]
SYREDFLYTVDGVAVTDDGIFVACFRGIFRSTDLGETWTPVTDGLDGAYAMELATDGTVLYSETSYGERIFRWNGAGWDEVNTPVEYSSPLVVSGDSLYTGDFAENVYASHDGGETWTRTSDRDGVDTLVQSALLEGDLLGWNVYTGMLRRSDDGGYTWTDVPVPSGAENVVQHDGLLYVSMYMGGVHVSENDGADWDNVSAGLPSGFGAWVQDLAVTGSGEILGSTYQSGPYRYDGTRWNPSTDGMIGGTAYDATLHDGRLLTVYGNDEVWSYDAGADEWIALESPAAGAALLGRIRSNGDTLLASSGYYGLYRSVDDGSTWTDGNNGFPTTIGSAGVEALTVWDVSFWGDTVVAAHTIAYEGSVGHGAEQTPTGGGVSVSTNAGGSWRWDPTGLPTVDYDDAGQPVYPSSTAVHASAEAFLLGTVGYGVYRSVDEGESWEAATGITGDTLITAFARAGDARFAGGYDVTAPAADGGNGLWRSEDDGATWVPDVTGLPERPLVADLASTGTTVFALVTAPTAGIWRRDADAWTLVVAPTDDVILQAPLVLDGEQFYVATTGEGILRLVPV